MYRSEDHPLSELMRNYQQKAYDFIVDAREQLTMLQTSPRLPVTASTPASASAPVSIKKNSIASELGDGMLNEGHLPDLSRWDVLSPTSSDVFTTVECKSVKNAEDDKDENEICAKTNNTPMNSLSLTASNGFALTENPVDTFHNSSAELKCRESRTFFRSTSQKQSDIYHDVASKIQTLVDRLEMMFMMTYEQLDTNCLAEDVQRALRSTLEVLFFQHLWPHVTALYRFE